MTHQRRVRWAVMGLTGCSLLLSTGCGEAYLHQPTCEGDDPSALILVAQAVPSATFLPCIAVYPTGWSYDGSMIEEGSAHFWLDSDRAGLRAVEVTLTDSCDLSRAEEVPGPTKLPAIRAFTETMSPPPSFRANRYLAFEGGCVTYTFRFDDGAPDTLALEAQQALSFIPRSNLVEWNRARSGLILCGAEAPPCPG